MSNTVRGSRLYLYQDPAKVHPLPKKNVQTPEGSSLRRSLVKQPIDAFLDHFGGLEDRREAGKILHPLPEILLVTLCGVLAGAEGFENIEDYGESKLNRSTS